MGKWGSREFPPCWATAGQSATAQSTFQTPSQLIAGRPVSRDSLVPVGFAQGCRANGGVRTWV